MPIGHLNDRFYNSLPCNGLRCPGAIRHRNFFTGVRFFTHRYTIITIVFLSLVTFSCATAAESPPPSLAERTAADQAPPEREHREEETAPPTREVEDPRETDHVAQLDSLAVDEVPQRIPERRPDLTREEVIERIIAAMPLEERVGQLFMPAIITDSRGEAVLALNDEIREMIEEVRPGGVILFGANLRDPIQTRTLVGDLQSTSKHPMFIAVDQEGGVVSRLTTSSLMPATVVPSARRVGLTGDVELAYRVARTMARELRALGITMNFAPVADVLTNPENPVIGSRAYGSDPLLVARMVAATVEGFQDNGISAVIKHFPGHGDTALDSHNQAVVVSHALDRLREIEFTPFASGFDAGADGVMTAHISLPNVTGDDTPSTLSPVVLRRLLREEFAYEGLIVTDSLTMGALTVQSLTQAVKETDLPLRAFQAGADILLYPRAPEVSHRRIVEAVRTGIVSTDALEAAVRRILRVKFERGLMQMPEPERYATARPDTDAVMLYERPERFFPEEIELGLAEHHDLMQEVYRRTR